MAQLFANNAVSTLASQLNAGSTTLAVQAGHGAKFPSPANGDYFLVTLYSRTGNQESSWEIVKCTSRSTDLLTIARGQEGTTDVTWAVNTPVELRLTAGSIVKLEAAAGLTAHLEPNLEDMLAGGWMPYFCNQTQGGYGVLPQWVDGLGVVDTITTCQGYTGNGISMGSSSADLGRAVRLTIPRTITNPTTMVRVYKVGNPTDNLLITLRPDSSGLPGSSSAYVSVAGKVISGDAGSCLFPVTISGTFTAGTYFISFARDLVGGYDANNYYRIGYGTAVYPSGLGLMYTYTAGWASGAIGANSGLWFALIDSGTARFIQPGGPFGRGVIGFNEAPNLGLSAGPLYKPLCQCWKDGEITIRFPFKNAPASKTLFDVTMGPQDHDRIVAYTDSSGHLIVKLLEQDSTVATITGTTDIRDAVGWKTLCISLRCLGDGNDYLHVDVCDVEQGVGLTAQSFTFDPLLRAVGIVIVGGGFPAPVAWTEDVNMSALPSTQGWAVSATSTTEAAALTPGPAYMTCELATGQNVYATKTVNALDNTTGWCVDFELAVDSSNDANTQTSGIEAGDGVIRHIVNLLSYYGNAYDGSNFRTYQLPDIKGRRTFVRACAKGNSWWVFVNARLVMDGTGLASAFASKTIKWLAPSSGAQFVRWYKMRYYTGGPLLPQVASGMQIAEFDMWTANRRGLGLWNGGSIKSARDECGLKQGYVERQKLVIDIAGITTAAQNINYGSPVIANEMTVFVLGRDFDCTADCCVQNKVAAQNMLEAVIAVDGEYGSKDKSSETATPQNDLVQISCPRVVRKPLGLHKFDLRLESVSNLWVTAYNYRRMVVRGM